MQFKTVYAIAALMQVAIAAPVNQVARDESGLESASVLETRATMQIAQLCKKITQRVDLGNVLVAGATAVTCAEACIGGMMYKAEVRRQCEDAVNKAPAVAPKPAPTPVKPTPVTPKKPAA